MTGTLVLDGMNVPVETGGHSRRARLTIERDGSLRLRAAGDVETRELKEFLASKREWIYKKLAEKEALEFEPITKELVDGEGFLYLGRSYRLQILKTSNPKVRMDRGRLVLPQALERVGSEQIIGWYENRARAWVRPRLTEWSTRLRVEPGSLEIADLGYKWGAATPGGRVRIHWAAMQLRPSLIDYVIAHELTHLREPHHGPAFWQRLGRSMPDYESRREDLARGGISVWLGNANPLDSRPERTLLNDAISTPLPSQEQVGRPS